MYSGGPSRRAKLAGAVGEEQLAQQACRRGQDQSPGPPIEGSHVEGVMQDCSLPDILDSLRQSE